MKNSMTLDVGNVKHFYICAGEHCGMLTPSSDALIKVIEPIPAVAVCPECAKKENWK